MFVASFLMSIALMPHLGLGVSSVALMEKGHRLLGYVVGGLALIWLYAVVSVWCWIVLWTSLRHVTAPGMLLPVLIRSYGIASGPWSYLAHLEPGANSAATVFFLEVGYIIMVLMILFGGHSFIQVMEAFVAIMGVATVLSLFLLGAVTRQLGVEVS